jgi:hypothetical protein
MKTSIPMLVGGAALAALITLSSCEKSVIDDAAGNPLVGKSCTIQFRRDVLGVSGGVAVSPAATQFNGAETTIEGLLRSTHGEWVVIDNKGQEVWIPKSVILSIRF